VQARLSLGQGSLVPLTAVWHHILIAPRAWAWHASRMKNIALALLLCVIPSLAFAAAPPRAKEIARVEAYLSGLTTLVADFTQIAPDGSVMTGKFYLKRPGNMRWDYAPPSQVLLISDGEDIIYYDGELAQVNYLSLDDTLAAFLTQPNLRLESEATRIVSFESGRGVVRLSIAQKGREKEGVLTLEFTDGPLKLRQMKMLDAAGNLTSIQLQNAEYGVALSDKLFIFRDPRGATPRRMR
jgi:outer membrane lipoprotein-sorting protein